MYDYQWSILCNEQSDFPYQKPLSESGAKHQQKKNVYKKEALTKDVHVSKMKRAIREGLKKRLKCPTHPNDNCFFLLSVVFLSPQTAPDSSRAYLSAFHKKKKNGQTTSRMR